MTNTGFQSSESSEVQKVVREVVCLIDLGSAKLDDAFFPAHLSVALIDTVFNPRLDYYERVVPIIERYCRRFGLSGIRRDRESLPAVDEQETLTELIHHYEDLGADEMRDKVFRARNCSPGTGIPKSDNVRLAAEALRGRGIKTLQDAVSTDPKEINSSLLPLLGINTRTIRMLLTYLGNEDFVKGDRHVIRFVSDALGSRWISAETAEQLVTAAARELGIAPRLLDNEIWNLGYAAKR